MSRVLPVFIGHDGREADATKVCESSLLRHASIPLHIQRISEPALRHTGIYRRQWYMFNGQRMDSADKRPFSTTFSFARFMTPTLLQHRGVALYCDSDFLFLSDVAELLARFDPAYAVQVVKHQHQPAPGQKMDGVRQEPYYRKNWSSLILWNCDHPANQRLTPHMVNGQTGQWLHSFSWLDDTDIGELPGSWNWLSGVDPMPRADPDAIHFTLGPPSMAGHEDSPFADLWRDELAETGG